MAEPTPLIDGARPASLVFRRNILYLYYSALQVDRVTTASNRDVADGPMSGRRRIDVLMLFDRCARNVRVVMCFSPVAPV
jgi:hypothetical protein